MALNQDEKLLFELIAQKDDTALARLFDYCGLAFIKDFQEKFPNSSSHEISDIVTDSLISFCENSMLFNPEKSGLIAYLRMDISRNLSNYQRDTYRRLKKFLSNNVELDEKLGNIEVEGEPDERMIRDEEAVKLKGIESHLRDKIASIFPNHVDQKLAWLIGIEGIRETNVYASLLSIDHLNTVEKESEVKKAKDRIKVKLKRSDFAQFKAQMQKKYES